MCFCMLSGEQELYSGLVFIHLKAHLDPCQLKCVDSKYMYVAVLCQFRVFMVFPFANADAQSLSHSCVSKERSNSHLHWNTAVNKYTLAIGCSLCGILWPLAVVSVVCSSAMFWPSHRRREMTQQSPFDVVLVCFCWLQLGAAQL